MAINQFSDPALNPAPRTPVVAATRAFVSDPFFNTPAEFRPPKEAKPANTGVPLLDLYLNTPAEIHRVGDHTVEIHRDPATHIAFSEEWRDKDGKFDRATGAADIDRDPKTGVVIGEEWFKNGVVHRIGAPAVWGRDQKTGVMGYELWYENGKLHREGGPAWNHRDPDTGSVLSQAWFRHGERLPDPCPLSAMFANPLEAARRPKRETDDATP